MAGNAVTEVYESRGNPTNLEPLLRGYISGAVGPSGSLLTVPATFPTVSSEQNRLWVICPEYSTIRPLGPCWWNADHGSTLPAQSAKCVVAIDDEGVPTVVSWEGLTEFSGSSGTGSWTNVTLAATVEEATEAEHQKVQARTEQGATTARLRGAVKVKAGDEVLNGGLVLTVPFHPPGRIVRPLIVGLGFLSEGYVLKENGELINGGETVAENQKIHFDFDYNLT